MCWLRPSSPTPSPATCRWCCPLTSSSSPGRGVTARIDDHRVQVGKLAGTVPAVGWARAVLNGAHLDTAAIAWVSIDGAPAGAVLLRHPLRRHAPRTVRRLRAAGLNRLVMLTGDRAEPAREIATVLGLDEVYAEQSPADKVAAVRAERDRAVTVMVGDGVNDAPAPAAATVGVAMGARGATASSQAADVVLTTDRLDRVANAMDIAGWSRRIAVQSAVVGMSLSLAAMAIAALGWLPPAARAAAGGHRHRGDRQRPACAGGRSGGRGRAAQWHRANAAPLRDRA